MGLHVCRCVWVCICVCVCHKVCQHVPMQYQLVSSWSFTSCNHLRSNQGRYKTCDRALSWQLSTAVKLGDDDIPLSDIIVTLNQPVLLPYPINADRLDRKQRIYILKIIVLLNEVSTRWFESHDLSNWEMDAQPFQSSHRVLVVKVQSLDYFKADDILCSERCVCVCVGAFIHMLVLPHVVVVVPGTLTSPKQTTFYAESAACVYMCTHACRCIVCVLACTPMVLVVMTGTLTSPKQKTFYAESSACVCMCTHTCRCLVCVLACTLIVQVVMTGTLTSPKQMTFYAQSQSAACVYMCIHVCRCLVRVLACPL